MTTENQKIAAGPVVYVALGDSTGAGVGATNGGYVARLFERLKKLRPSSSLVNRCVSGATTRDLIDDQLTGGIAANPDLITVGIGINDIGHGVSQDQFAQNFEEILKTLREKSHARIVVTNIPDISSAPSLQNSLRGQYHQNITEFNKRLEEIAKRYGVTVFDVYAVTHEGLPGHPEYFSADGFHPSDQGYEFWAQEMWPTLSAILEE